MLKADVMPCSQRSLLYRTSWRLILNGPDLTPLQYASSILYSVSVVVPSEMGAAGGLYQVMTSLAPAIGNVSLASCPDSIPS